MENYSNILIYGAIAPIALLLGGIVSILKKTNAQIRSAILHFAAGVIFSVVAVEILPEIMAKHDVPEIAIGFGAGVLLMLGIRYFLEPKRERKNETGFPTAFILVIAIDLLIDGVLMGIGFVTSQEAGIFLAVAISVELLSLGMATSITLGNSSIDRKKTIATILGLSLLVFGSTLLSAALLAGISIGFFGNHFGLWIGRPAVSGYRGIVGGGARKQAKYLVDRRFFWRFFAVYVAAGRVIKSPKKPSQLNLEQPM